MRKTLVILAACGVLSLGALGAAIPGAVAEPEASNWPGRVGRYVFEVTRDGKSIGTQIIEVQQNGDTVTATTESTIAVKLLGIVVYRMHQVLTETYRGERLVVLHAETKDPDGLRAGEIARDGDHWTGTLGKQRRAFDCDCMTTTMWNVAAMNRGTIIEASQARLRTITVEERGNEMLDLPEGRVTARHFVVKGEIEREVWYDSSGNLVSATQIGSDGSLIRQTLLSDPSGSHEEGREASEP